MSLIRIEPRWKRVVLTTILMPLLIIFSLLNGLYEAARGFVKGWMEGLEAIASCYLKK